MVAAVCSVGGVSACGNSDKTKAVTQTAGVPAQNVEKVQRTADVKPADTSDTSVSGGSGLGAFEKTPRFTLVLGEGKGGFKFRSTTLSDEAKAKIDEMFTGEKVDLNTARFEIDGYTDNLGSKEINKQVGLARANAVKQYLGEQYEIPADWMTVVSYGMEKPVADNATPDGRAKNRRVVIKVAYPDGYGCVLKKRRRVPAKYVQHGTRRRNRNGNVMFPCKTYDGACSRVTQAGRLL
jgi:outer membrane protein OmpA-like peptidoglycan-associated protein